MIKNTEKRNDKLLKVERNTRINKWDNKAANKEQKVEAKKWKQQCC